MERRYDNAVVLAIEQCEAETLVAADIFEWIEADETDAVEAFLPELVEFVGDLEKFLDLSIKRVDLLAVPEQNVFSRLARLAIKEGVLAFLERADFYE